MQNQSVPAAGPARFEAGFFTLEIRIISYFEKLYHHQEVSLYDSPIHHTQWVKDARVLPDFPDRFARSKKAASLPALEPWDTTLSEWF